MYPLVSGPSKAAEIPSGPFPRRRTIAAVDITEAPRLTASVLYMVKQSSASTLRGCQSGRWRSENAAVMARCVIRPFNLWRSAGDCKPWALPRSALFMSVADSLGLERLPRSHFHASLSDPLMPCGLSIRHGGSAHFPTRSRNLSSIVSQTASLYVMLHAASSGYVISGSIRRGGMGVGGKCAMPVLDGWVSTQGLGRGSL